jgi:hypothetical protein
MTDLENRHPDAGQRHEVALRLFENRLGQDRRAGAEVENAGGRFEALSSATVAMVTLLV